MKRLKNKVALVTGAGSGIGRAIGELFAREGAAVIFSDIDAPELSAFAIDEDYAELASIALDVASGDAWAQAKQIVEDRWQTLDILVNCAGMPSFGSIEDIDLYHWRKVQTVNTESVFLGVKSFFSLLRRRDGGAIVNISSVSALNGMPLGAAYGVSKCGMAHITKSIARYCGLKSYAVRCNAILPGFVDTPMLIAHYGERGNRDAAMEKTRRQIPLKRFADSKDIANAALFLSSDESSYITGTQLIVDGGVSA